MASLLQIFCCFPPYRHGSYEVTAFKVKVGQKYKGDGDIFLDNKLPRAKLASS